MDTTETLSFTNKEETINQINDRKLINQEIIIIESKCPITKIIKNFGKQFAKFYLLRFLLSLLKKLIKIRFNIFKISPKDLFSLLINLQNLQTGLFLCLMPTLFRFLNLILHNSNKLKSLGLTPIILTFISGFISSLIGIVISEKANIMNFVVLSVLVRSIHSLLVVWLDKNGYPTRSRFGGWFVLTIACSGVILLTFYHPSFKPITKLVNRYALLQNNEQAETDSMRKILRII